jgi:SAM-dependent methyltransferase
LRPEDWAERCGIQLYHHLLSSLPLKGSRVLEVGCGRCGGAIYVRRYLAPSLVVGLDLSAATLRTASERARSEGVLLLAGDAQELPLADESFDVVINIESSHAYVSMTSFLQEIERVLVPGGFLVFADLRWAGWNVSDETCGLATLKERVARCGLRNVQEADISSSVVLARTIDATRCRVLIREYAPTALHRAFAELAALPGTTLHQCLRDGTLVYWSALLQRPAVHS